MSDKSALSVDRDDRLAEVLDAYLAAHEGGTPPDMDEFLARYPDLAGDLRECLASLAFIRRAGNQSLTGDTPAEGEAVGGVLGDFRILREVGKGGMGIVYEAEQISLRRRVALKVLPFAATMDTRHLQRFHNEARAAACLHHANIVPVYFVGSERGVHFYAMQFIEGKSLAELIAAQRRDSASVAASAPRSRSLTEESRPIAAATTQAAARNAAQYRCFAERGIQAAEALEHAHSLGIVHRDIKPSNLMIDGAGKLWITDFGLARTTTDAGLTMTGDVVGTLRYMSPEQALAKHGVVDHRSDIYALGATLYELLTLRPAVEGKDREEILRKIVFEEPLSPRSLDRAIPADLDTIVCKAMAKEPAERYTTAQELAEDLRRFQSHRPIRARPLRRWARMWRWCRRNPVLAVLACALAGTLVLSFAGLATGSIVIWHEKVRADEAYQSEAGQRRRAEEKRRWARKAVNDMYSEVAEDWLVHEPHMTEIQKQFLRRALEFYEELAAEESEDPDERLERAAAFRRMADIHGGGFHRAEGAEKNYRQAVALCEELAYEFPDKAAYQAELVRSQLRLGGFLSGNHRRVEAEPFLLHARIVAQRLASKSPNDPQRQAALAECEGNLGGHWSVTDLQKAEAALTRALMIRQELARAYPEVDDYRDKLAFAHLTLGELLRMRGRLKETEQAFKQAVLLLEARRKKARLPPWLASTVGGGGYHLLAEVLLDQRRSSEAEKAIRRSVEIRKQVDRDFPGMPYCWHGLAMSLSTQGRILRELDRQRDAVASYREAVEYQQRALADNPEHASLRQDTGVMRSELAWLVIVGPLPVRDTEQAGTQIQKALELEPENSAYLTVRAIVDYRLGEWTKSLRVLRVAVRDNDANDLPLRDWVSTDGVMQRMAERQARTAFVANGFFTAMCLYRLGKKDEARECYRRALQRRQAQKIDEPAHVAELQAIQREAAALLDIQE